MNPGDYVVRSRLNGRFGNYSGTNRFHMKQKNAIRLPLSRHEDDGAGVSPDIPLTHRLGADARTIGGRYNGRA
jgi:hypothetical protein